MRKIFQDIAHRLKNILKYLVQNNLVASCLSLIAIIISLFNMNYNNDLLVPKFSMIVFQPDNVSDLNRNFKIYNCGGQFINPQLSTKFVLELNCDYKENDIPKKKGNITIELTDFFGNDIFFDYKESAFTIEETKGIELYYLINKINEILNEEKSAYVCDFSFKHYFYITYYDYKGKRKEQIFEPLNNYNYILYNQDKDRQIRYFKDNELLKKEKIEKTDIAVPIEFFYHNVLKNKSEITLTFDDLEQNEPDNINIKNFVIDRLFPIMSEQFQDIDIDENGSYFLTRNSKKFLVSDTNNDLDVNSKYTIVIDNQNTIIGYQIYTYEHQLRIVIIKIVIFILVIVFIFFLKRRKIILWARRNKIKKVNNDKTRKRAVKKKNIKR